MPPSRDEAAAILTAAFTGLGPFVLKDPRCTTLAPFWERVVPQAGFALRRILIIRDPAEVAESQRQRVARRPHEFPVIAESEPMTALWAVTMWECLQALSDDSTLLVSHADLLADPTATLTAAAAFVGLPPAEAAVARFVAEGIRPDLYRARLPPADPLVQEGVWMQAARALFADLMQGDLPRPLTAARARAHAAAQSRIAALMPGLPAVQASIARMLAVDGARRSRTEALYSLIWALAPLGAQASAPSLAAAIDRATTLAETSDLAQSSFAYAHTVGRLLLFAQRREDALAWLDRIRPQFGHLQAFAQLEQRVQTLPPDSRTTVPPDI